MKKATSRAEFLEQFWPRYPSLPETAKAWGRLSDVQRSASDLAFKIDDQFFRIPLRSPEALFCENQDLVALDSDGALVLLAPNVTGTPSAKEGLFQEIHIDFERLKKWNFFLSSLREFFQNKNFIECLTPSLVSCPGSEPTLEVFPTEWRDGKRSQKFFLPTSPELHLKKILSFSQDSKQKIFEITKSFRNSEISSRHQPEFTILEWYRPYEKLDIIKKDIIELVQFLKQRFPEAPGVSAGLSSQSFKQIYKELWGFDLSPKTTFEELKSLAQKENIYCQNINNFEEIFNLLYIEKIEAKWPMEELFFIEKYPPSMAALARLDNEGWAERFEFYWQGLEIANAFHELNDPVLQKERFEKDLQIKRQYGFQEIGLDAQFMEALERGMPPTSGVALGVERLFMALFGIKDINQVKIFSWNR